jgi:hypothetical protein
MTTSVAATTTGGVESLTDGLGKLSFPGAPEVVAAFRIGWEVACLTDPSTPTVQSIQDWKAENLTEAAERILRIESAFTDLNGLMVTTETLTDVVVGRDAKLQAAIIRRKQRESPCPLTDAPIMRNRHAMPRY